MERPFLIANCSGWVGDRTDAMLRQAQSNPAPHAIVGDWQSELTIGWSSRDRYEDRCNGTQGNEDQYFLKPILKSFDLAVDTIVAHSQILVTNAGGLSPKGCAEALDQIARRHGHELKIAYVTGDDLLNRFEELSTSKPLQSLDTGEILTSLSSGEWTGINAYIGAWPIVEALNCGANVVVTGRVTDATPVIALAAWKHGWNTSQHDLLAQALLCGHVIECSMYATGGNFSGFKSIRSEMDGLSFPLAEILADGTFIVTKNAAENGIVTAQTVISQILYEIQGNIYINPDVQADLHEVVVKQIGKDRVEVKGAKGYPPPKTAKLAVFAVGGYQAEAFCFATGLDYKEKFDVFESLARTWLSKQNYKFTKLSFQHIGQPIENGKSEIEATTTMRIFAQAKRAEDFPPNGLAALVEGLSMGTYPGFHRSLDLRCTTPKLFMDYWPSTIEVNKLRLEMCFLGHSPVSIPNHSNTAVAMKSDSYDTKAHHDVSEWGPTVSLPLGTIIMGRSGDKGSNANIGLFVRNADEYDWFRTVMTAEMFKEILGDEAKLVTKLERVEFPGMLAVHFLCRGLLGGGVCSTDRLDGFSKSMAEYVRARRIDLPEQFVRRGGI